MSADRVTDPGPFRVTFVCTGNICRSPMGEIVLRALAEDAGWGGRLTVTSSGTGGWHAGDPADPRTVAALDRAGYDGAAHRAAQVTDADIAENDLIIALARDHERALLAAGAPRDRLVLLTDFDPDQPADPDVFDPYFSDDAAFDAVLAQVERASRALLASLEPRLRSGH
ncbi:low molecular weight phosphotyrosine protein phosphatase [Leucobacter sp. CSA2]|uniref:protein-tyrosine-phosphatase n=1 Tax=Leucobacter edaphi TaxID=2796472 RepID=A0A934QEX1_9MICO|nr:low molecular weight protein-tyrosine-phosphatase [Leucobacter edaphi]MBK0421957.1 low molecular weight phosphotyrosine protein phosphatase [Leucobacter edaphi]